MAMLCKGKRVYRLFWSKLKFLISVYLWSCSTRLARPLTTPQHEVGGVDSKRTCAFDGRRGKIFANLVCT